MRTNRLGARQAADSAALGDMQAEAEGDTEDMNRERAETHWHGAPPAPAIKMLCANAQRVPRSSWLPLAGRASAFPQRRCQGQPVAQATVTIGGEVRHITLVASRAAPAPAVR
jgi:hypothetical protein